MEENRVNTEAESEARRMMLLNDYANKLCAQYMADERLQGKADRQKGIG